MGRLAVEQYSGNMSSVILLTTGTNDISAPETAKLAEDFAHSRIAAVLNIVQVFNETKDAAYSSISDAEEGEYYTAKDKATAIMKAKTFIKSEDGWNIKKLP